MTLKVEMYEIIPSNETTSPVYKPKDKSVENVASVSDNKEKNTDTTECKTATKYVNSCNDSGFDDFFDPDTTEKTCLLSETLDNSRIENIHAEKEKDNAVYGIGESSINYQEYAAALKDVRKQVDKRENGKKKKVRISEDVTDIKMIPHRYEYCVNYGSGYFGYKNGTRNEKRNTRVSQGFQRNWSNKIAPRYYYRYCFDTEKSGRHYTARWGESDEEYALRYFLFFCYILCSECIDELTTEIINGLIAFLQLEWALSFQFLFGMFRSACVEISLFLFSNLTLLQTKWQLPPQSVSDGRRLTINVGGLANRGPLVFVFWFHIAIKHFALLHHMVFDYMC